MVKLTQYIQAGFPDTKGNLLLDLHEVWMIYLLMMDKGIMCCDHERELHNESLPPDSHFNNDVSIITIPPSLRTEVHRVMHSVHREFTAMNERAEAIVFWPGITNDIQRDPENCSSCNLIAPCNPRLPPIEPLIPKVPFESIFYDYFLLKGWYLCSCRQTLRLD